MSRVEGNMSKVEGRGLISHRPDYLSTSHNIQILDFFYSIAGFHVASSYSKIKNYLTR